MTHICGFFTGTIARLEHHDLSLESISLYDAKLTESQVDELIDCLSTRPNKVKEIWLGRNQLADKTGVKLARYVASNPAIKRLSLVHNQFGEETYLAMAAALRVNKSLRVLDLRENPTFDDSRVCGAFIESLLINPVRPFDTRFLFFSPSNVFKRLNTIAKKVGSPSMLSQLDFAEDCRAETKTHMI